MASDPSKGAEKPPLPTAEEAPDPDEDDLSDLDDVLDQFTTKLDTRSGPSSSGPGRPPNTAVSPSAATGPTPATAGLLPDDDNFARQLQESMQNLLGTLDNNPEMAAKFEELMQELSEAADTETMDESGAASASPDAPKNKASSSSKKEKEAGSSTAPAAAPATPKASASASDKTFQDSIRKTMERMQNSSESASAAAASSASDDLLSQLLKEMESDPGAFPAGMGSDDFSKMLMGMMEQLTNKEILYEPMKELDDKFPKWMEEHQGKVEEADWKRYEEQRSLVREIVGKFEEKGYSDEKVECREYIVERMQKMQAAGNPPPELVGDMNAAQEALGEIDAGCPTQ